MEAIRPTLSAAQMAAPPPGAVGSPLFRLNRALASPIAHAVALLGFAPGQLSLQSLTVSVVGIVGIVDGRAIHLLWGAGLVYAALLLDRADLLLAERKGPATAWTAFLGSALDRLVELALAGGLVWVAVRGAEGFAPALVDLPMPWTPVLAAAAGALWLARTALAQSADTYLLRAHLLTKKRLPGPTAMRHRMPPSPIGMFAGRDEAVLAWCIGVALGQVALTAIVLTAMQAVGLVEGLVLFRIHLRDPEGEASRVLSPDYR